MKLIAFLLQIELVYGFSRVVGKDFFWKIIVKKRTVDLIKVFIFVRNVMRFDNTLCEF